MAKQSRRSQYSRKNNEGVGDDSRKNNEGVGDDRSAQSEDSDDDPDFKIIDKPSTSSTRRRINASYGDASRQPELSNSEVVVAGHILATAPVEESFVEESFNIKDEESEVDFSHHALMAKHGDKTDKIPSERINSGSNKSSSSKKSTLRKRAARKTQTLSICFDSIDDLKLDPNVVEVIMNLPVPEPMLNVSRKRIWLVSIRKGEEASTLHPIEEIQDVSSTTKYFRFHSQTN
jgi:hypothetical protein